MKKGQPILCSCGKIGGFLHSGFYAEERQYAHGSATLKKTEGETAPSDCWRCGQQLCPESDRREDRFRLYRQRLCKRHEAEKNTDRRINKEAVVLHAWCMGNSFALYFSVVGFLCAFLFFLSRRMRTTVPVRIQRKITAMMA